MRPDNVAHEHFCSLCFGRSSKRRDGWWRCVDKKCVKLPTCPCKRHAAVKKEATKN